MLGKLTPGNSCGSPDLLTVLELDAMIIMGRAHFLFLPV